MSLNTLTQIEVIHESIKGHYSDNDGVAAIWGKIISYFFVYKEGYAVEISPAGIVFDFHENYTPSSSSSISVDNKKISFY